MKKYRLGCVLLLSALALAACGKKAEAPKASETAAETKAEEETKQEDVKKGVSLAEKKEEKAPEKEEGVQPVHVYMKNYSRSCSDPETYNQMAYLEDVYLLMTEEDGKAYPALKKALEKNEKERMSRADEMMAEMVTSYMETAPYIDDVSSFYMTDEQKGAVLRADSRVVSMLKTEYSYYGGAHPGFNYIGVNYDTETGEEIRFADVITDEDRFYAIATEKMSAAYGGDFDNTDVDGFRDYCHEYDQAPNFTLGNEGFTVYFNEYEIGSYAQGAFMAYIGYAEYPDLFAEKYTEVPENYVMPLMDNMGLETDINGDGMMDYIFVDEEPVGDDWYYKWHIYAGDQELVVEDDTYSKECYVVKNNGKYYLYLYETSDNDYTILKAYDLTDLKEQEGGNFLDLTYVDGDFIMLDESTSENWSLISTLTDPACVEMSRRLEILGTLGGRRFYAVGKDGNPEPIEDSYRVRNRSVYRAKMDVDVEIVDAEGKVISKGVIEEGTCLYAVRTDGTSYMDMQEIDPALTESLDEEGNYLYTETDPEFDPGETIYRVPVDAGQYPCFVNGMDETEVFAGIMYAG